MAKYNSEEINYAKQLVIWVYQKALRRAEEKIDKKLNTALQMSLF